MARAGNGKGSLSSVRVSNIKGTSSYTVDLIQYSVLMSHNRTDQFQPMDISVNKAIKASLKVSFSSCYAD